MKKLLWTTLVLLLVLGVLSGCGSSGKGDSVNVAGTDEWDEPLERDEEDTISSERTERETEKAPTTEEFENIDDELDALETKVMEEVEACITALNEDYEKLRGAIKSYKDYADNSEKVAEFYTHINETSYELSIKMYRYALEFGEKIMSSDLTSGEKYDAFKYVYDCIYDDAGDEIYDGIYDGLLDDMYDDFYDGVIDEGYDTVPYKEWSSYSAAEYKQWSKASSECYEHVSDMQADVYDFYSDMQTELYNEDIDRAEKILERFKNDVIDLEK